MCMICYVLLVFFLRYVDVVLDYNFYVVSELCCIENEYFLGGMMCYCVLGVWLVMDYENGNL